jgi:acetoin:2,6-dichlorophenolindophenol oxidoreductase subunit alpha
MTAAGLKDLYRAMVLIREAEETVLRLFSQNRMPGFIHFYIGEEATAVGVCAPLRPDDYVTSTHRGYGHIVAKGGDLKLFFAELYGKAAGTARARAAPCTSPMSGQTVPATGGRSE